MDHITNVPPVEGTIFAVHETRNGVPCVTITEASYDLLKRNLAEMRRALAQLAAFKS